MIYFLSDAHLGSLAIEKGWAHQNDKKKHQYAPFFKELRKLSKQGIHVHIFTGNHDLWTFGGMAQLSNAEIHYEPCTILRYGKAIYLAHGDGLLPSNWESLYPKDVKKKIKRFMRLKDIFRSPFLQFCFRCLPPSWGNKFGYEWAKRSRLKEIAKPCPYKGEDKEELVLFAKEQEKQHNHRDYYIFGHRHIELDLQISKDSRVVILGDCFKEFTYAKLDHNGNLTLHNYEQ